MENKFDIDIEIDAHPHHTAAGIDTHYRGWVFVTAPGERKIVYTQMTGNAATKKTALMLAAHAAAQVVKLLDATGVAHTGVKDICTVNNYAITAPYGTNVVKLRDIE